MNTSPATDLINEWVQIPLADGRSLAAHLWRPQGTAPLPAILDISPYRAFDIFRPREEPLFAWWAARGYAVLAIDTSGAGGSAGLMLDEYRPQEINDAVAAVAWAAEQTWCDGAVGLNGLSWAAFTALRAADHQPPALKAMVLGGVSEDGWTTDIQNLGGATYTARVDWAGVMLMFNALPPDPKQFGPGWREAWLARLERHEPWIGTWLSHPERDNYWQGKAASAAGHVPLMLYSGWADKYATSTLRIAASWRGPVRTFIGPWEHAVPTTASRGPRIGFLQEALRWWDRWLKGRETGAMDSPPLRLWVAAPDRAGHLEDGVWRGMDWPMAQARSDEHAFGAGELVLRPDPRNPTALAADLYEDEPGPWPTTGALLTEPTQTDQEIIAAPVLRCRLRSDRAGGLLVARLLDVAPDGQAVRMTTAALNLAFHDGSGHAAPPKAGETLEVALPFQATAWRLKAGHRLGLLLSADGWPTLWPARSGAVLTLDRASMKLSLPLASGESPQPAPFDPPQTAAGASVSALKWLDPAGAILPPSGLNTPVSYTSPPIGFHLDATGTDYRLQSRFDVALTERGRQAAASKVYRAAIERPEWSIRITTSLLVRSSPDAFVIDWSIQADEGGKPAFSRKRRIQVPRSTI